MNIIIIGPPLAGKGTQSKKIIEDLGLTHLSTGDALRKEAAAASALGLEAAEYSRKGLLAPDELVARVVEKYYRTQKGGKGILFDGYPRNMAQATHLTELLESESAGIHLVIFLNVPQEILLKRAKIRAAQENRKDDKDPKVVLQRIKEFEAFTIPILPYFKEKGIPVIEIDGNQGIDEIYNAIKSELNIK